MTMGLIKTERSTWFLRENPARIDEINDFTAGFCFLNLRQGSEATQPSAGVLTKTHISRAGSRYKREGCGGNRGVQRNEQFGPDLSEETVRRPET